MKRKVVIGPITKKTKIGDTTPKQMAIVLLVRIHATRMIIVVRLNAGRTIAAGGKIKRVAEKRSSWLFITRVAKVSIEQI